MKVSAGFMLRVCDENDNLLEPERVESILNAIMESLTTLDGVEDPAVGASLTEGLVEVSVTVSAQSLAQAQKAALSGIRTAIHSAGGYTPEWEKAIRRPETAGGWCIEVDGWSIQRTDKRQLVSA